MVNISWNILRICLSVSISEIDEQYKYSDRKQRLINKFFAAISLLMKVS